MKYSNLILLISILFCSCSQTDDIATSQPKETHIEVFAATDNSYVQTRAEESGGETIVPFGVGDNLGMYILSNGAATPFAGNSNNLNIKATKDSNSWTYVMQNSAHEYSSLFIASNDATKTADFYAYAPWWSANTYANTYMKYPNFNLDVSANQVDLKWARQNSEGTLNKGIVLNGETQIVHFTFQRATALISCKFATAHKGSKEGESAIHITGFTVTAGHSPIYKSGKLNITTGEWNTKIAAGTYSHSRGNNYLKLNTSTDVDPYPTTYDIFFLPITTTEMESSSGADLMYITFNQYNNMNGLPATITLKKSQFPNGLEAGKKYNLYITWEDYLKIDNIQIDEGWTDVEKEIIKEI